MFYLLQKNPLIPIRHFCFEVQLKTKRLIHPLLFDLKNLYHQYGHATCSLMVIVSDYILNIHMILTYSHLIVILESNYYLKQSKF